MLLAQGRKTKIDLDLPYAVSYMQALSTTMSPFEVIKRIYEEKSMFGEVSLEFGQVVRDVGLFGDDLITALRNVQKTTPSPLFRDFINDLGVVYESGGDITAYLSSKTVFFHEQAKRELDLLLKTIEIMAEVYVSAFVPVHCSYNHDRCAGYDKPIGNGLAPPFYVPGDPGRCHHHDLDALYHAAPGKS